MHKGPLHGGPGTKKQEVGLQRDESHLETGSGYGRTDPQKLGRGI